MSAALLASCGRAWNLESYRRLLADSTVLTPLKHAVLSCITCDGMHVFAAVEVREPVKKTNLLLPRIDLFFFCDGDTDFETVTTNSTYMKRAPLWRLDSDTNFPDAYHLWVINYKPAGLFLWLHLTKSGWLLYGTRRKCYALKFDHKTSASLPLVRALRALPQQAAVRALLESRCATACWKKGQLKFFCAAAYEDDGISAVPRRLGPYNREELCSFAAFAAFRSTLKPRRGYIIVDTAFSVALLCETAWYQVVRAIAGTKHDLTSLTSSFLSAATLKAAELQLSETFTRDVVLPYVTQLAAHTLAARNVRIHSVHESRLLPFASMLHKTRQLSCHWVLQVDRDLVHAHEAWCSISDAVQARIASAAGVVFTPSANKSQRVSISSAAALELKHLWETAAVELALHAFEITAGVCTCRCTVQFPLAHPALAVVDDCGLRLTLGHVAAAVDPPPCVALSVSRHDVAFMFK